ncbi:MAG: type II toxin-antitoxin system VapC family toxin [Alphaproteobacteria bacterium]|nr:type II toxin-antitoxin system VapC family toxin [Alphaproteobacteria bacterium]
MIILDTNVVSEPMRPRPAPEVMAWLASRPIAEVFTTSITQAEVLFGIECLPDGDRRQALKLAAWEVFTQDFQGRVLEFGSAAADHYASIRAARKRLGRPVSPQDVQIAAIARLHGAAVATRNVTDFTDCGIDLINPWTA